MILFVIHDPDAADLMMTRAEDKETAIKRYESYCKNELDQEEMNKEVEIRTWDEHLEAIIEEAKGRAQHLLTLDHMTDFIDMDEFIGPVF